MASLTRPPAAPLRPFVSLLWAMDEPATCAAPVRELMVPTGTAHIVFRLGTAPLRIFDSPADQEGTTFRHGVLGAPRSAPHVRDASGPTRSVGAMLRPGVAALLLGTSGEELVERHLGLDDLWGREARQLEAELGDQRSLPAQLEALEHFLLARLPRARAMHPAVAHGLGLLAAGNEVGQAVQESGYSHRRFLSLFRQTAGFTPKLFARLMRFQKALALLHGAPHASLSEIAFASGYSDQAHFTRECVEFAGMSPSAYRKIAPRAAHHVPMPGVQVSSRARGPGRPS